MIGLRAGGTWTAMARARSPALVLVLLAACTTHTPSPDPIVTRRFVGYCPVEQNCSAEFSRAIEAHGIDCPGFEGSIKGSNLGPIDGWRTDCHGTEQEWRRAESTIARLEADGITQEMIDRYFAITDPSDADDNDAVLQALRAHGMTCLPEGSPAGSLIYCAGNRQEWRQAEPTIARLTGDGVVRETSGRDGD